MERLLIWYSKSVSGLYALADMQHEGDAIQADFTIPAGGGEISILAKVSSFLLGLRLVLLHNALCLGLPFPESSQRQPSLPRLHCRPR